jgi:putative transposase
MQDSHTVGLIDETTGDPSPLRLVSAATMGLPQWLHGRVDEHLARFVVHMTEGLLAASTAVGLEVMAELMQVEATELAGPKGRHDPTRTAKRHGSEQGTVTLGGRRLAVRRPRVRTAGSGSGDRELPLESYTAFASTDLLAEGIVTRMLAGLSTRRYGAGLEPVGQAVEQAASGTSKSAVSRRFVAATAERLAELLGRPLDQQRWLIVFLDGFGMGEHLLVGALGVTDDGTKVPLGVAEGTTENAAVCTRLVSDLAERGLDASQGSLFVVDGGKALDKAIRSVFGAKALIQRCRRHKERNVVEHLPEAERPLVQRKLRAAWALGDPDQARAELEQLARSLARQPARGARGDVDRDAAWGGRLAAADGGIDQPGGIDDRDRA